MPTDSDYEELDYQIVAGLWAYNNQHGSKYLSRERYAEIRKMGDYSPYNGQAAHISALLRSAGLIHWPKQTDV